MYSRYELTDALVDPKRLLRLEGVDCVSYQTMGLDDLPRADAYYDPRPDINAVFYNEDAQFERLRFTLAHELGHKVLGHHDIYAVTLPRIEQEREANAFAAELLAPSPLIHLIGITQSMKSAPLSTCLSSARRPCLSVCIFSLRNAGRITSICSGSCAPVLSRRGKTYTIND